MRHPPRGPDRQLILCTACMVRAVQFQDMLLQQDLLYNVFIIYLNNLTLFCKTENFTEFPLPLINVAFYPWNLSQSKICNLKACNFRQLDSYIL